MTNDRKLIDLYRRNAPYLHTLGLDDKIKKVTHHRFFKPIVHAEILVDDCIRRSDRLDSLYGHEPSPFFNEAQFGRYIGSSKPLCRLCALYFAAQSVDASGVKVRASHHNLYYNWRAPDVFEDDDMEVDSQRRSTLEQMVKTVRNETFRAIRNKGVVRNVFDSNNSPSDLPPGSTDRGTVMAMATNRGDMDMVSMMGELSVRDEEEDGSTPESTPRASPERSTSRYRGRTKAATAYIDAQAARRWDGERDNDGE